VWKRSRRLGGTKRWFTIEWEKIDVWLVWRLRSLGVAVGRSPCLVALDDVYNGGIGICRFLRVRAAGTYFCVG